jgi:hypothetical protein
MGRMSRGWALTKQSWRVLKNDRSLVVFPVLSTIFAVIAAAAILMPVALARGLFQGQPVDQHDPVVAIAGVVTLYVATFIAIFFNVALAACAVRAMQGEDTTIGYGISAAMHRLGPILGWTLLAATVGLVLRTLEERLPLAGRIAVWLVGSAWAIATFFVVPVVALEGDGPWRSLKRSASVVKARWGEGATGAAAISLVTGLVSFVIVLIGTACAAALFAAGQPILGIVVAAIGVVAIIVVSMISTALNQIFRVAVYQYAVTGDTPSGFDGQLLQNAFAHR